MSPLHDVNLRDVAPGDAAALAHVLITSNEQAFRGRVPDQCLTFTEAESAANWREFFAEDLPDGDVMVVAQAANDVVGYAWGGPNSKDTVHRAELRQIAVLPAFQRRGIGRALLCHIARRLAEQERHSLRVDVLRVNPNRLFYERLGARYVSEYPFDWDDVVLPMCVYGWPDTRNLLNNECG